MKKRILITISALLAVLLSVAVFSSGTSALSADEVLIDGVTYSLDGTLPRGVSWDANTFTLTLDGFSGSYIHFSADAAMFTLKLIGENTLNGFDTKTGKTVTPLDAPGCMVSVNGGGSLYIDAVSEASTVGINADILTVIDASITLNLTVKGTSTSAECVGLSGSVGLYNNSSLKIAVQNLAGSKAVGVTGDQLTSSTSGMLYVSAQGKDACAVNASAVFSGTGAIALRSSGTAMKAVPAGLNSLYTVKGNFSDKEYTITTSAESSKILSASLDGYKPAVGGTFYKIADFSGAVTSADSVIDKSASKVTYADGSRNVVCTPDTHVDGTKNYTLSARLTPTGNLKYSADAVVTVFGKILPRSAYNVKDGEITLSCALPMADTQLPVIGNVPSVQRDNGVSYDFTYSVTGNPDRVELERFDSQTSAWKTEYVLSGSTGTVDGKVEYNNLMVRFRIAAYSGDVVALSDEFSVTWNAKSIPLNSVSISVEAPVIGKQFSAPTTVGSAPGYSVYSWGYFFDGLAAGEKAESGCEYELRFDLVANAGYLWNDNVTVLVNGASVQKSDVSFSDGRLSVKVHFTTPSVIPEFTQSPEGGSVPNGSAFKNNIFQTSPGFTHITLQRYDGTKWVYVLTIPASGFDIPYTADYADNTVKFRLCGQYQNGGSLSYAYSREFFVSWYTQTEKIISITATVPAPVGGNVPAKNAVSGDASKYSVTSLDWNGVAVFTAGQKYKVRFTVIPTTGNVIDMVSLNSVRLNGVNCTFVSQSADGKGYIFECELTADYPAVNIKKITVSGVTDPMEGKQSTIAGITLDGIGTNYSVSRIVWLNADSSELGGGLFAAGRKYILQIDLITLHNATFTPGEVSVSATDSAPEGRTVLVSSSTEATVFLTYIADENKALSSTAITIMGIEDGRKTQDVSVSAEKDKYSVSIRFTLQNANAVIFAPSEEYVAYITLTPLAGYSFESGAAFALTVNGHRAFFNEAGSNGSLTFTYSFICPRTQFAVSASPESLGANYRENVSVSFSFNKTPASVFVERYAGGTWVSYSPCSASGAIILSDDSFAGTTQIFRIKGVSSDGDTAYSAEFSVTWEPAPVPLSVSTQPVGGLAGAGENYNFYFDLSTPADSMVLEIMAEEGVWTTQSTLYSFYGEIPYSEGYFGKTITFRIRVQKSGEEPVYSDEFTVKWLFIPSFSVQPVGGSVRNGEEIVVRWTTNSPAVRVFLQTFEMGEWVNGENVISPLSFAELNSSKTYRLCAVIDDMEIYSDTFVVSFSAPGFTTQPEGGSVKNNSSFSVTFRTNFASRTGYRLQYKASSGVWIDSILADGSPFSIPYSAAFADKSVSFRLIGDFGLESEFYSSEFVVTWSSSGFLTQPIGGQIANGNDYTIVWSCSETPKSISLETYTEGSGWTTLARSLTGTTYTISGSGKQNTTKWYRLSAIISGVTVYSNEFSVKWSGTGSPEFILQPSSGTALNGKNYTVKWTCNSPMTSYHIFHYEYSNGEGYWNYWGSSGTTSFDIVPTKNMTDTTERFRIKAFYTGGSTFSQEFVVKWSGTKYTIITNAALSGVAEPIEGRNPTTDESLIFCNGNFTITDVSWFTESGTIRLKDSYEYVNGQKYIVRLTVIPEAGYDFVPADLMHAVVNGKADVTIEKDDQNPNARVISLSFTATPAPKFTSQPKSSTVTNGKTVSIKWGFNLTPISVTLQYFDGSVWADDGDIASPYTIPAAENIARTYRIKAVFEDGSILYSDYFTKIWTDGTGTALNDDFHISGLIEPSSGAHPDVSGLAVLVGNGTINTTETYWESFTGNRWQRLADTDSFSVYGGAKYRLHLVLTPTVGCYFGLTPKVFVNGEATETQIRFGAEGKELLVVLEYTVSTSGGTLKYVYVNGVPELTLESYVEEVTGALEFVTVNNGWMVDEIQCFDRTEGRFATGMFIAGHTYEIRLIVEPRYGFSFTDASLRATVNSDTVNATEITYNYRRALRLTYVVTLYEEGRDITVGLADVKIKNPVEEAFPEFVVTPQAPDKYSVEILSWINLTTGATLIDTDSFVAGNVYRVTLRFTSAEGYVFAPETVFQCNSANTAAGDYFDSAVRTFDFVAEEKQTTVVTTPPDVTTEEETAPPSQMIFTVQPQSTELLNGADYVFTWDVSFRPSKTPILERYDASSGSWVSYASLFDKSWELTYREFLKNTSNRYRIRAEYNGLIIYSSVFTVTYSVPRFSENPVGGIVKNGEPFTITFKTNVPVTLIRIERSFSATGDFTPGRDSFTSSPYDISCGVGTFEDYSNTTVRFRLYAESAEGDFYSEVFTVTWTSGDTVPFFTRLPNSGTRKEGESYKVNWACSIQPNRMFVEGDLDGDGVFETQYAVVTSGTFVIPYEASFSGAGIKFRICADYGSAMIYSSEFIVRWEAPETEPPVTETEKVETSVPEGGGKSNAAWLWLAIVCAVAAVSITAATVLMYLVTKRRGVRARRK